MKQEVLSRLLAAVLLPGVFISLGCVPAMARETPEGISTTAWKSNGQEYERNRHAAFAVPGGYQARNHSQQWLTRFDGRGFQVSPDSGNWSWGLQLESYGRPGQQRPVQGQPRVTTEKERVTYDWGQGLREWWVNDAKGLEHGFKVHRRPVGEGDGLELRLSIRGGLQPRVQADGRGVTFLDRAGQLVVNYTGLKVWDADGYAVTARLQTLGAIVQVEVDDRSARYPLTIDPIAQQAYLKASNAGAGDQFGVSVAVSGDTIVVGAPGEDSSATGVNGNQSENNAADSGAVYVFARIGGVWTQQAYLKAPNTGTGDGFGVSVAASGDTIVVGAPGEDSSATGVNGNEGDNNAADSGAVYVFARTGGVWTRQAYLKASNTGASDGFGLSVAVSGDTVVIGAQNEDSSATGVNGNEGDNSAPDSGAAYVFFRNGTVWTQQSYVKASNTDAGDRFGSVAMSADTIVVGAPLEDSSARSVNGNGSDNTGTNSGAAYLFVNNAGVWTQQAYLKGSKSRGSTFFPDEFGRSVAIWGDTVVIGAPGVSHSVIGMSQAGAVYVFVQNAGLWTEQAYLENPIVRPSRFGSAVALSASALLVGSINLLPEFDRGVYVFVRSMGTWVQHAHLKGSNTEPQDLFGTSVAVSGDTVVVGAPGEDSNATGVNGNGSENSASESGAVYVFLSTTATDTTAPQIVPTITGNLGANGWYTSDVMVTWSVTDPESGVSLSTGCGATNLTTDTAGTTVTCSATNGAGLSNSVSVTIKIDKTSPAIVGVPGAHCSLWPPNHKLVQVGVASASAGASGLTSFSVTGQSSEPENGVGDGNTAPDIVITGSGLNARTVQLRAERSGTGTGRIYTIRATAVNAAGTSSTVSAVCTVPKNQAGR